MIPCAAVIHIIGTGHGDASAGQKESMRANNTILIVDDDPVNIRSLKRILVKEFDVATARSGVEALERISSIRPDLILLDIMMPELDGYEICRRIRADDRFSLTKIILVSGKGSTAERLAGYEAGADDYITRPFVNEELKAKVRIFMRLKRAETVEQIKGDLISLVAHETKTPLSGIIGMSEILMEDSSLDDNARLCAKHIHQDSNRLLEFVQKASLLLELKTGMKLRLTSGSLSSHLKGAVSSVEELASRNGVSLAVDLDSDLEWVADWEHLERVFGYVLHNAVKYAGDGGNVFAKVEADGGQCRVTIGDTGQGMEPEWVERIFDEFAIHDLAHHHKGQGLSLAISKHIVDLHGGSIEVESSPGKGAVFTFCFPLEKALSPCPDGAVAEERPVTATG